MSIRIPQRADREVQDGLRDTDQALADLRDDVRILRAELDAVRALIPTSGPAPSHTNFGDVTIHGNLHVAGDTTLADDLTAPGQLDGFVGAGQSAEMSPASRVVGVHGSLAVSSALSAETGRFRNLQIYGATTPPFGRTVSAQTSALSTSGTGETDLHTYTLRGGTFSRNGDRLIVRSSGTMTNNGNTKTIRVYFDSTSITLLSSTSGISSWGLEAHFMRQPPPTTVYLYGWLFIDNAAYGLHAAATTAAVSLTADHVVKVTGQMATSGSITATNFSTELWPAP